MGHIDRVWVAAGVASAKELADKVTGMGWCLCTGFRYRGYLFLNDALSVDGAQEYAAVREANLMQVESIMFS